MLVEFGLPIGPKQTMLGWFSRGMITLLLRFWGRKAEIRDANKKSEEGLKVKEQMEGSECTSGISKMGAIAGEDDS